MKIIKEKALPVIASALREDLGPGDITSAALFEKDFITGAHIIAKEPCVLAGIDIARWVFDTLDEKIDFRPFCKDGDRVEKGKKISSIRGSIKNILTGERTALNFLSRLSGVATLTNKFVRAIKGTGAEIFDTRKTTPGLRELEKYAVRIGGGTNHRMGLWDQILIKDNHLAALKTNAIRDAVRKAKDRHYKNIEVEVATLKEFKEALAAGADIIMLDNIKTDDIKKAVKLAKGTGILLEASGGVTLENVRAMAKTGINRISVGSLTHSTTSIDFSLEIIA